ncbi:MAG: hypothetical protein WB564_06155 [Dehalococcoidia bacterium]
MAYKKKTLRHMQPITRRYARIINDLDGVTRRLKNLTQDIARLELDSAALFRSNRQEYDRTHHAGFRKEPGCLDDFMDDYFKQQEDGDEL